MSALKLLAMAWQTPSRTAKLPKSFTRNLSALSLCQCSSIKPQANVPEKRSSESLDPFGIEEIASSKEKSSIVVQGFYAEDQVKTQPDETPKDSEKQSRLSVYDSWIKQREHDWKVEQAQDGEEGGAPESVRSANFGTVRMDSDNIGQTSTPGNDFEYRANRKPSRRLQASGRRNENEPVIETIEADQSRIMRASDFLQELKGGAGLHSVQDARNNTGKPVQVIHKLVRPHNAPSMDPNDPSYSLSSAESLVLDSNVIPKPYQMPDYNAITEQDMWNVLKKTLIFQNDFLIAINKPYGIPVHSKARSCRHTIIQFLKKFADLSNCEEIYPLHRLDKETTGVLLFAKDKKIAAVMKEKFAKRQITKVYLAVTKLCPHIREATINIPVGESQIPGTKKFRSSLRPDLREYGLSTPNRECVEALTKYKVLHSIKEAAFVEVQPVTGVKHQIRVHLGLGLGCPIIGDHKYSHRDRLAPQRLHPLVLHKLKVKQSKVREVPLHLHCNKVGFTLPKEYTNSSEPIYIHAKIPMFMKYTLRQIGLIR